MNRNNKCVFEGWILSGFFFFFSITHIKSLDFLFPRPLLSHANSSSLEIVLRMNTEAERIQSGSYSKLVAEPKRRDMRRSALSHAF